MLTAIYIFWFWYSQNLLLIVLSYKPLFIWFLIDFFFVIYSKHFV